MRSKLVRVWFTCSVSAILVLASFATLSGGECDKGCHEGKDLKLEADCYHYHRTTAMQDAWTDGAIGGTKETTEISTQRDTMAVCTKECPDKTFSWADVDPYSDIIFSKNVTVNYCGSAT